jgi:hypothetical protein
MKAIIASILKRLTREQLEDIVREQVEPPNPFSFRDDLVDAARGVGVPLTPSLESAEPGLGKTMPIVTPTERLVRDGTKAMRRALGPVVSAPSKPRKPRRSKRSAKAKLILRSPGVWEGRAYQAMHRADRKVEGLRGKRRETAWTMYVRGAAAKVRKQATEAQFRAYQRVLLRGMQRRGFLHHG